MDCQTSKLIPFSNEKIYSTLLDENFHSSIRKEVNPERLLYLSKASQELPLPLSWGKFISDAHYLATVDLFIKATNETRNRGIFFIRKILPLIKNRDKILDVGPGNGKLTRWVSKHFKEITLIDPVPEVLENISLSPYPKEKVIKKILQSFENTILPKNYFDLIIFSHVMYHFPEEKWIKILRKALLSLKSEGVLVIVFNSGLDRETLGNNFEGKTYPIENFFSTPDHLDKKVELFSSRESFYAGDLLTMMHICGLHLHDLKGKANLEDLEKYIKINYLIGDNTYKMEMYQHFIVIKNAST